LEVHQAETFTQSYAYSAISLWNALPKEFALEKIENFKQHIASAYA
jgi:hypothetical protein